MKTQWMMKVGLAAMVLAGVERAGADDLDARISFSGSVQNSPIRQAVFGYLNGRGEYGKFNLEVDLKGTLASEDGTRTPEPRVTGKYPVEISLRVSKSGVSASDTFTTDVTLRRRALIFSEYGKVRLVKPVNPRREGRQRIRGSGILAYDF